MNPYRAAPMIAFALCIVLSGCSAAHHGDATAFCSHKVEIQPAKGLPAPESLAELEAQRKGPYWKSQGDASLSDCEKTTEAAARSEELSVGQYVSAQEHAPEERAKAEKSQEKEEEETPGGKEIQKTEEKAKQQEEQAKKEGLIE